MNESVASRILRAQVVGLVAGALAVAITTTGRQGIAYVAAIYALFTVLGFAFPTPGLPWPKNVFNIEALFLLAFTLPFGVGALTQPLVGIYSWEGDPEFLPYAILVASAGVAGIAFGFELASVYFRRAPTESGEPVGLGTLYVILCVLAIAVWMFRFYLGERGVYLHRYYDISFTDLPLLSVWETTGVVLVGPAKAVLVALALMPLLDPAARPRRWMKVIGVLVVLLEFGDSVVRSHRSAVAEASVLILFCAIYLGARIRWSVIVSSVVVAFLCANIAMSFRLAGQLSSVDFDNQWYGLPTQAANAAALMIDPDGLLEVVQINLGIGAYGTANEAGFLYRISPYDFFTGLIRRIDQRGMLGGQTLADGVLALIPRFLWPDKDVLVARFALTSAYDMERRDAVITPITELYANFGVLGVFLGMTFLGVFMAQIHGRYGSSERASYGRLLIYGTAMALLFNIEQAYSGVFISLIKTMPFVWVLGSAIDGLLRRRPAATELPVIAGGPSGAR